MAVPRTSALLLSAALLQTLAQGVPVYSCCYDRCVVCQAISAVGVNVAVWQLPVPWHTITRSWMV